MQKKSSPPPPFLLPLFSSPADGAEKKRQFYSVKKHTVLVSLHRMLRNGMAGRLRRARRGRGGGICNQAAQP